MTRGRIVGNFIVRFPSNRRGPGVAIPLARSKSNGHLDFTLDGPCVTWRGRPPKYLRQAVLREAVGHD